MKAGQLVVRTVVTTLALVLLWAGSAHAFKPYTHNTTAFEAYNDAISCDDPVACASGGSNEGGGDVTLLGSHYALDPAVVAALRAWPEYYNAGVIGPDGFPDLIMGQGTIHPYVTGEWLEHILKQAWTDQSDGGISADEKAQILAFAYGYMTHTAGDLWAHTAVNDWARGVFPGVADILAHPDEAGIALRHLIVEGYVGDSTSGFDSNSDRHPLNCEGAGPDAYQPCLTDADCTDDPACSGGNCQCDITADSTPRIPYAAPRDFIYRTLVDPDAATPLAGRGPLIQLFLDLRAALVAECDSLDGVADEFCDPGGVGDLLAEINEFTDITQPAVDALEQQEQDLQDAYDSVELNCAFEEICTPQCIDPGPICFPGIGCTPDPPALCNGACFDPGPVCLPFFPFTCSPDPAPICAPAGPLCVDVGPTNPVECAASLAEIVLITGGSLDVPTTPAEFLDLLSDAADLISDFATNVVDVAQAALELDRDILLRAYLHFWIDDIDTGLQNWPEGVGLALTRGMFDPQTKRDLIQHDPLDGCAFDCNPDAGGGGDDSLLICANCEATIGMTDVAQHEIDPFIGSDVMKMLGAPDGIVELSDIIGGFSATLQIMIGGVSNQLLNPLEEDVATIQAAFNELYLGFIRATLGVDLEQLSDFLNHSPEYLCTDQDEFDFPPPLGPNVTIDLFDNTPPDEEDDRLDVMLGLILASVPPAEDPQLGHHEDTLNLAPGCGPLFDEVETAWGIDADAQIALYDYAVDEARPLTNAAQLSRLLLLDGDELNRALGDALGRTIATYADGATPDNIMVRGTTTVTVTVPEGPIMADTWLRSIDGDHQWRSDGMPRYCNAEDNVECCTGGNPFCGGPALQDPACTIEDAPCPRAEALNGGNGTFPIWESCVLRPAFRLLFEDWENGSDVFPDHGDTPSADPANDPEAPTSDLVLSGPSYDDGGTIFVGSGHSLDLSATDSPPGQAFAAGDLELQYCVYPSGDSCGTPVDVTGSASFSLSPPDGSYDVDFVSGDPCHPLDGSLGSPEGPHTRTFVLDTTPPECDGAISGETFATDETPAADFAGDDGAGSGVDDSASTVDGEGSPGGSSPVSGGAPLDLFHFYPGVRSIELTDNVGNSGGTACTFELHATSFSLESNVDRAVSESLLTAQDALSLNRFLERAQYWHNRGALGKESREISRFVALVAAIGPAMDADLAARFTAWGTDLVSLLPPPPMGCGIGFEIVPVLALIAALRRRRA